MEEQNATTGEMTRNIAEAAESSSNIALALSSLAHVAENGRTGAHEARAAAGELGQISSRLEVAVHSFQV